MEMIDIMERDTDEIVSMLSEHGVRAYAEDTVKGAYLVSSDGMGEFIASHMELCVILWGVIAGKRRAASMI